jgi:hypothetical protein
MSTKSIFKRSSNVPRVSISDYLKRDNILMSDRQKKALIELVYQNIFEENDREMYVAQINEDSMTSEEANMMALDFQMASWK